MNDTQQNRLTANEPATYEIRLQGQLPERWAAWFGEVAIGPGEDGTTVLTCPAVDQAALYGLLKKVRSLGLPLLSVVRVERNQTNGGE
jgi:uncharacterized protein (DUF3820 family)